MARKAVTFAAQIFHRGDHLAKCVQIIGGIILDNFLIVAPGREILVADKAVIGEMSRSAVPQVHNGIFAAGIQAGCVKTLFQVIGRRAVAEADFLFLIVIAVRKKFIEIVVGVVDNKRGRARKIAVRPGICQHMHGDAYRLQAFAFCQLDGMCNQITVGMAYQSELAFVAFGAAALRLRVQVIGEKMKGRPNARDVLQADRIGARVHQLKLQLRSGSGKRRLHFGKQGFGAQIHKAVAVADGNAFLVGITREQRRAVGGIIVKIGIHAVPPLLSSARRLSFLSLTEDTNNSTSIAAEVTSIRRVTTIVRRAGGKVM